MFASPTDQKSDLTTALMDDARQKYANDPALKATLTPTPDLVSFNAPAADSDTATGLLESHMTATRTRIKANEFRVANILVASYVEALAAHDEALAEKADGATDKASTLIHEAKAQLQAPASDFLPADLTAVEKAEEAASQSFGAGQQRTMLETDAMIDGGNAHHAEVLALIDELEENEKVDISAVFVPLTPRTTAVNNLPLSLQSRVYLAKSRQRSRSPSRVSSSSEELESNTASSVTSDLERRIEEVEINLAKVKLDDQLAVYGEDKETKLPIRVVCPKGGAEEVPAAKQASLLA